MLEAMARICCHAPLDGFQGSNHGRTICGSQTVMTIHPEPAGVMLAGIFLEGKGHTGPAREDARAPHREVGKMIYTRMESPVGPLTIAGDDSALRFVIFDGGKHQPKRPSEWQESSCHAVAEAVRQLRAYFAGRLTAFDLPVAPDGTSFQKIVWQELKRIPYGDVISYGELASRIGKPKASRAVGAANGANPIPIVIPCHRVIGSNGKLTGYGGGLPIKEKLLILERSRLF